MAMPQYGGGLLIVKLEKLGYGAATIPKLLFSSTRGRRDQVWRKINRCIDLAQRELARKSHNLDFGVEPLYVKCATSFHQSV